MKNATRKLALVLVALVMVLSLVFAACEKNHDYTVKVVDANGDPYTAALVQPCLVDETKPGGLGECYEGKATDENGVVYFDIGKEIKDKNADEIEVHLLDLPSNMTYTPIKMKKGENKTITVTEGNSGPQIKNPLRGTGVVNYQEGSEGAIDTENGFDPFIVVTGSYALTFTSATQKIYYGFQPLFKGNYKVYSTGTIDPSITMMLGTKMNGLYCWHEDEYQSDNISATDKNFSYEFSVDEMIMDLNECVYFEVALEDANGVDVDAVITFEYVSDGQGGGDDVTDVYAQEDLVHYAEPTGEYHDVPIDGSAEAFVTTDYDNFYHYGNEYGPIVFANLGTDPALNDRHVGMSTYPIGLDISFTQIVAQGANLIFSINDGLCNYYPLAEAYTTYSNGNGRYPLTDELIVLLDSYLTQKYTVDLFEQQNNVTLPDENPWIVWCGYYDMASALEEETTSNGSIDDPYYLDSMNVVTVPAGGSVYYQYSSMLESTTLTISIYSNNVQLTVTTDPEHPGSPLVGEWNDMLSSMIYEVEIEARLLYYFIFSTVDGEADEYWVFVDGPAGPKEGSFENPIGLGLGYTVNGTAEESDGVYEYVYYTYEVTEDDAKLYVYIIHNAVIRELYYIDSSDVVYSLNVADATTGLEIPEGMTLYIVVSPEDNAYSGDFALTLANKEMGNDENPFWLGEGTITINVTAGGSIYYCLPSWESGTYTFMSDADNIKVLMFMDDETIEDAITLVSEEDEMFLFTLSKDYGTDYYFVFTTANGGAGSYSVRITVEYPSYDDEDEGTEENPIIVYYPTYCSYDSTAVVGGEVYFKYTVGEGITKLYFSPSDNTNLVIIYNGSTIAPWDDNYSDILANGLDVNEDDVIIFAASLNVDPSQAEDTYVGFYFSGEPIED